MKIFAPFQRVGQDLRLAAVGKMPAVEVVIDSASTTGLTNRQSIVGCNRCSACNRGPGGTIMAMESVGQHPGKKDINYQFSLENIKQTLEHYNAVKGKDGDYEFGSLTNKWYDAGHQWMNDVKLYPQPIRDQI